MSDEQLQQARIELEAGASYDCEIWPENLPTVEVFLAMEKQWRMLVLPTSIRYMGLRYEALPIVLQGLELEMSKVLFSGLQIMEREALDVLNEKN
ncbi:DUF1799 domain-containing protein [Methylobacillus caricis]|uniref:DUF1799 domain-containing protein n=1 Tax=Methylobacillus caricis TaxID=1971611 RepID=UPI001D000FCF|nr:DUF1799 domain-containing protein [Methylobacillus caricis]MCB5187386.1 DUF1799 domain-containing protein [Methylobacillus caricis]